MGVYWIKNESRFIEKSLKSVMDICSEIIVMDNNSTDDTVEICYQAWKKNLCRHYSISNHKSYSILDVARMFGTKI